MGTRAIAAGWIDAHHHLWNYTPEQYPWITPEMAELQRDFTVGELERLAESHDVMGAVAVQARETLEETRWLLAIAKASPLVLGVVGWAPLVEPDVEGRLAELSAHQELVGVRHVLQAEADPAYMERRDFNAGVGALERFGLTFDLLIRADQMRAATKLVDRHPRQSFILDHLGKPGIAAGELAGWRDDLFQLAERETVCCKVSGMVTEARWRGWSLETLRPYFDVVLEAFGPERLLFGSDWPVVTLAADYGRWQATVASLIASLSDDEAGQIMRRTATRVYGLAERDAV